MKETDSRVELEPAQSRVLPGQFLLLAGDALNYRLPMSVNHIARHLGNHVERLDVVGFTGSYGGPRASSWRRVSRSIHNIIYDRVHISANGKTRDITLRKLYMPEMLDMVAQGLWIYPNLRPLLASHYEVGLIYGPEHVLIMELLRVEKRVRHLVYIDVDNHATYYSTPWSSLVARLEKTSVMMADGVVSVSSPLAALRREQGARRVVMVPNGVDFPLFHRAFLDRSQHPPGLIYVGTLDRRWGIDLAVKAMPMVRKEIPEVRLLIVGEGPARQELEDLARSLGVEEAVVFAGLVPQKDLPALMAEADIAVATSRKDAFREYASPLKLCEYMAAGLPVVCSGGGDAEKMVRESRAGLNIPFSPEAFAHAVASLLNSPDRMAEASRSGIEFARSRSWEVQVSHLVDFLAEVAGHNGSGEEKEGR